MKNLKLNNLSGSQLTSNQLQTVKGGGICACRHQGERRSMGQRRGAIKEEVDSAFHQAR